MSEKDLTQKGLEDYADVFADTINALLYRGKELVREEQLKAAPTETLYRDIRGRTRNQFHDVSKYVVENDEIRLQYMLENQSKRERRMVLRKAGYEGAIYRQQLDKKELYPVVGIVLYWGKRRWKHPRDLRQLWTSGKVPEEAKPYIDDIRLHTFDMRHLPPEIRQYFRSDMRIVVDCLAEGEHYQPPQYLKLRHAEAFIRMMRALTGDERYEWILPQIQGEKGEIDMCPFLDKYINQGIERGIEQGEARGIIRGRTEGMAEIILSILSERGEISNDLRLRVMQEQSSEKLTTWAKLAAKAENIKAFCTTAGI